MGALGPILFGAAICAYGLGMFLWGRRQGEQRGWRASQISKGQEYVNGVHGHIRLIEHPSHPHPDEVYDQTKDRT